MIKNGAAKRRKKIKLQHVKTYTQRFAHSMFGIIVGIGMMVGSGVPAYAASATYGGGNVQGYAAENALQNGTVVEFDTAQNRVSTATKAKLERMFGVVVDRNQLPMQLTDDRIVNQTFVATSGTYNVLVSTQGGPIANGDVVTMSSIDGVATKAGTEEKTVLGRAAAAFDGKGVTLGMMTLKDAGGNMSRTVSLGLIPVTIGITRNPNQKSTKANVPPALERIGQAIAEKEVSPIRIYLSMAITVVSLIAAIVTLYAGIRNSVVSIGRNPMSKRSIFRALVEIILTSLLIVIVGLFAVYLLLKL